MARQYGTRSTSRGRVRRPASSQDVCLTAVTWGKAAQAAAELGTTVDELCEAAVLEHLEREAAALFEREFRAEQTAAEAQMRPTPMRNEFRSVWRPPAWSKP
jgi:hypothetical protein